MYAGVARYYDKIYSFKDYAAEAGRLTDVIRSHLHTGGKRLLDVACGTGRHLEYLREQFDVEGLDISVACSTTRWMPCPSRHFRITFMMRRAMPRRR